jgi:tRNA-splicing ligase RtcB
VLRWQPVSDFTQKAVIKGFEWVDDRNAVPCKFMAHMMSDAITPEEIQALGQHGKPLRIYAEAMERSCLGQIHNVLAHPAVNRMVCLPDIHMGYTQPIGSVTEVEGFIFPSCVGMDIGCKVSTVKTTFRKKDLMKGDTRTRIMGQIYRDLPVGKDRHKESRVGVEDMDASLFDGASDFVKGLFLHYGVKQAGTLGDGNHFVEIGYDEEDCVYVTVHSGSRHVGAATAQHYIRLAHPENRGGEGMYGFEAASPEGQAYYHDMSFCSAFALLNHRHIHDIVNKAIRRMVKGNMEPDSLIVCEHNHAVLDEGTGRVIHRKGATQAEAGQYGVIPGNMRDGVFIVKGKGNPDALYSSSHGAGRIYSRKAARENCTVHAFRKMMEEADVTAQCKEGNLDENPGAYKDIFQVLDEQRDLIEVISHIRPLINIKSY